MLFVFDTSAYINGWRDHYPQPTFPGVWRFIEESIGSGHIISPREVFNEIKEKDDDIYKWARKRVESFVDPIPEVQGMVDGIYSSFRNPTVRNKADPWVIAEAKARLLTVVTYEGRTFSGVPTKRWDRSMPGICQYHTVPCITLPEALQQLGGSF